MPVVDLSAYKPVPATLGDANQIANGFQAIQTALNGLDNLNFAAGLIFDPAKLMQAAAIDGDPLVWDNTLTKWKPASLMAAGRPRAPRMTISTMAGGPPASPVDGDIWVATSVDAVGTRWAFQYNSAAATYKWEFIGGPPTSAFVFAQEGNANNGAWSDLATVGPAVTVARAGDYAVFIQAQVGTPANVYTFAIGVTQGAANPSMGDQLASVVGTAGNYQLNGAHGPVSDANLAGVPAATSLRMRYWQNAAVTTNFSQRRISVVPVRVI